MGMKASAVWSLRELTEAALPPEPGIKVGDLIQEIEWEEVQDLDDYTERIKTLKGRAKGEPVCQIQQWWRTVLDVAKCRPASG